jgi:uncharacterized membrane protein
MHRRYVLKTLALSSLISVALFIFRAFYFQSTEYWYLLWNLFLAWLPLLFAGILVQQLHTQRWLRWQTMLTTVLWLGFLPNSFYLVTDFIHLQHTMNASLLYDSVLLFSFSINGFILGYLSLAMIHKELNKRLQARDVHIILGIVFLACSFAIYLGRYLRWNTWDVLINPAGILFDVTDQFINPGAYGQSFLTTMLFFVFIGSTYAIMYRFASLLQFKKHK